MALKLDNDIYEYSYAYPCSLNSIYFPFCILHFELISPLFLSQPALNV